MTSNEMRHVRHTAALIELGSRVRQRREAIGQSLRQVAMERTFTYSWLAQVERGEQNPSLSYLIEISDALEMDLSELVRDLPI